MRWADKDHGKEHKEGMEAKEVTEAVPWTSYASTFFLPLFFTYQIIPSSDSLLRHFPENSQGEGKVT